VERAFWLWETHVHTWNITTCWCYPFLTTLRMKYPQWRALVQDRTAWIIAFLACFHIEVGWTEHSRCGKHMSGMDKQQMLVVCPCIHHSIFPNEQTPPVMIHQPQTWLDPIQPMPPEVVTSTCKHHHCQVPKPEV